MIAEKNLDEVNIENPNREELELILNLLDAKIKESGSCSFVLAQEFHPEGGYANRLVTLKFAKSQHGQRLSAPFVLLYFSRDYYQRLLEEKENSEFTG